MLHLADSWVWDFWLADDGERYHMFFLHAPRSLPSPNDRHFSARVGHAVSSDLKAWERVADALGPDDPPAFDDMATWTGSVVRGDDDKWYLFYTGASRAEHGLVQRIGLATSADLFCWERAGPVLVADERWYETLDQAVWPDQAWRDPWVVRDPAGGSWHMLFTARSKHDLRTTGALSATPHRLICFGGRQLPRCRTGPRFRPVGSAPGGSHRGPARACFSPVWARRWPKLEDGHRVVYGPHLGTRCLAGGTSNGLSSSRASLCMLVGLSKTDPAGG